MKKQTTRCLDNNDARCCQIMRIDFVIELKGTRVSCAEVKCVALTLWTWLQINKSAV